MAVYQCIGNEEGSMFGIQDMHGSEMLVSRLDTDDFLGYLDGVGIFGVQTSYERIGFSCFYHHHTEIVAFEHLVVCLLEVGSLTGAFLAQDPCIAFSAVGFPVKASVDDLYANQIQIPCS